LPVTRVEWRQPSARLDARVNRDRLVRGELDRGAGELVGREIAREVEGLDGEVRREARVWWPVQERLGEGRVGRAVLADLT
jgi:hypothetical protein